MKSKAITYSLLTVVAMIWGVIFFKIVRSLGSSDRNPVRETAKGPIEYSEEYDTVGYVLNADYRDPFLGSVVLNNSIEKAAVPTRQIAKRVEQKVMVDWSFVKYLGLIRNSKSQQKIGLISINNHEFMIRDGEIIDDVKCLKHYKDSILISYRGQRACIKR